MIAIGSILDGKYKILNQIGAGGMSTVYLAMNEKANRQWAVKEIRKDRPYNFALMRQGIVREMELLRCLNHPMIPKICDVIEEEEAIFIVMDYIEGRTLGKVLEEEGAQKEEYVIEWAKQLCQVLSYLHNRVPAVIYRDMKPSNIMLRPNGDLMLIDFGISREFCEEDTQDTVCLGTKGYAAPEQFGAGQSDERTDIYGLGATLHDMITGETPKKRHGSEFLPVRAVRPEVSDGLGQIIEKCLQKDPGKRYQSCREVWFALEHYQELDSKRMKSQKRKLFLCGGFFAVSFLSLGLRCFCGIQIMEMRKESYQLCMQMASNQEGEGKIQLLKKAISVNPTEEEGYLKLLEAFLEDDNFSREEDISLREILNETQGKEETYEMKIKANQAGYEKLAYEIGIAYFFFYEETGNKERSLKWFEIARQAQFLTQSEKTRAAVCERISRYWKDMGKREKTGDFKISHAAYLRDLEELYQMQKKYGENEIMKLKVCQEMVMQILQYSEEMKRDGIETEEITGVLEQAEKALFSAKENAGFENQEMVRMIEREIEQARQKLSDNVTKE